VPASVIYPGEQGREARVMAEVLTKQLVLDALAKDTK